MKLEDLLLNPDTIEKLSDKELTEIFAPYFKVTRPEEGRKTSPPKTNTPISAKAKKKTSVADLDKMLAKLGL